MRGDHPVLMSMELPALVLGAMPVAKVCMVSWDAHMACTRGGGLWKGVCVCGKGGGTGGREGECRARCIVVLSPS